VAVDTTQKAINLCSRLADAADRLMIAVEDLANLKDEKESSGLVLTAAAVEDALATSSLKHASGANFNSVISSGAAIKSFMETNFHDDVLAQVRP
jgi:hypothetical protein